MSAPTRRSVAAALVLFVVGLGVGRAWPQRTARPVAPAARASAVGGPGPVGTHAGMGVGYRHDPAGAQAAALGWTGASQRWLYETDAQVRAAVAAVTTPEAAGPLGERVAATTASARQRLLGASGRVWWFVRPLAARVTEYGADRARVVVWSATVLSARGVAVPQADWTRETVELAWRSGDWRVTAVSEAPGPTPAGGAGGDAWQAEAFDAALDGFTRLDGERRP